jgi:hypothetical protein
MKKINKDLRCLWINTENLFLLFDSELPTDFQKMTESKWQALSTSIFENKPLKKTLELAEIIREEDPDIMMLCEVGGEESLKNFSKYFLNSNYQAALIEGNSKRTIDVGYLIHNRCQFQYDLISNKERLINFIYPHEDIKTTPSHKFSRDVLELHLFTKDRSKPFMIFLTTHLKSPLDPESIDPGGAHRRAADLKSLVDIYQNYASATCASIPIIVSGDFNGNASKANTDPEFKYLYEKTDLIDVLELENIPQEQRATFYHVRSGGRSDGKQIDFAFLSPAAQKFLKTGSARVCRYKNDLNQRNIAPSTLDEKLHLPSDHYPIVFTLSLG